MGRLDIDITPSIYTYMEKREQINVRIGADTKKKWEDFTNNHPDAENLSHLIRLAMSREMNRVGGRDTGENIEQITNLTTAVETLTETVERMDTDISELNRDLQAIRRSVVKDPRVNEIINDVYRVLPVFEPGSERWEEQAGVMEIPSDIPTDPSTDREKYISHFGHTAWSGMPADVAVLLDVDKELVQKALDQLQRDTTRIKTIQIDDKTRFYKDE